MAPKPKKKLTPYNRHVQKQMKAGRSMKQAAASWSKKSGKPKKAAKSQKPSKRSGGSGSTNKGGNSRMGKKGFNTQKMFKLVRMGSLAVPAVSSVLKYGFTKAAAVDGIRQYFGVNIMTGKFSWSDIARGYTPLVAATAITYGIPKIAGIIRSL